MPDTVARLRIMITLVCAITEDEYLNWQANIIGCLAARCCAQLCNHTEKKKTDIGDNNKLTSKREGDWRQFGNYIWCCTVTSFPWKRILFLFFDSLNLCHFLPQRPLQLTHPNITNRHWFEYTSTPVTKSPNTHSSFSLILVENAFSDAAQMWLQQLLSLPNSSSNQCSSSSNFARAAQPLRKIRSKFYTFTLLLCSVSSSNNRK